MSAAVETAEREARPHAALACVALWCVGAAASRSVGLWLGVGTAAVAIGALAVTFEGRTLRPLFRVDARALLSGVAMGAAMTAATLALYAPIAAAVPSVGLDVERLYATFGAPSLARLALLLPLVIACEEMVWRGVVQAALARRVGPVAAALVGAAVYAAAHALAGSLTLVLACVGCGLCWGALRAFTRGLVAPLIAHLMWDLAVLVIWPLA